MSLILGLGLASAQQAHPASSTTAKVVKIDPSKNTVTTSTQEVKKVKTVSSHSAVASTSPQKDVVIKDVKTATVKTNSPKVVLKKDGTPDKRYKTSQHLKKDGTPDKRYKANKS